MKQIMILDYAMLNMDLPIVKGELVFMKRKVNAQHHLIFYYLFVANSKYDFMLNKGEINNVILVVPDVPVTVAPGVPSTVKPSIKGIA